MKTGERLVKHAHCYWPLLAESHLTWRMFGGMVQRVAARRPAGQKLAAGRRTTEIKKEKERCLMLQDAPFSGFQVPWMEQLIHDHRMVPRGTKNCDRGH